MTESAACTREAASMSVLNLCREAAVVRCTLRSVLSHVKAVER